MSVVRDNTVVSPCYCQSLYTCRVSLSLTSVLSLLAYCPFGVLLLLFRLFLIPQALILLLIIPKGLVKRYLLHHITQQWFFLTRPCSVIQCSVIAVSYHCAITVFYDVLTICL